MSSVLEDVRPEESTSGHRHLGIALIVISVAQLMVVLDATIANIAIPYIQHDLLYPVEPPCQTDLTFTIQNIADADPPFAIGTQYNYDPGSGNPLGRVFAVGVKKKF